MSTNVVARIKWQWEVGTSLPAPTRLLTSLHYGCLQMLGRDKFSCSLLLNNIRSAKSFEGSRGTQVDLPPE